jgi:hypothetical protein
MATIIINEQDASPTKLAKSIDSALSITDDVIVVGHNRHQLPLTRARLVSPTEGEALAATLQKAAALASNSQLIIADARVASFSFLKRFSDSAVINPSSTFEIAFIEHGQESIHLLGFLPENIIPTIGLYPHLPLQIFRVEKTLALSTNLSLETSIAWGAALLIKAISDNQEIIIQPETIRFDSTYSLDDIALIRDQERAEILKYAIENNNIEDLFPHHAWNDHHQESAAASYHSLAALFVRLGDSESANECLRHSDNLEDSPRSLALKGIIAHEKGEVLGAVANLVSSLQQYETRKRNNGQHYLTFQPKDIENINSKLLAGLEALNKRENKIAFSHFAEAIFKFDDFYTTYGVDKIREPVAQ